MSHAPETNAPADAVPEVSGALDLGYLTAALRRAGRSAPRGELTSETLTGGRTGAQVLRVTTGDASFVLKHVLSSSWRTMGMRCPEGGEARLWQSGALRTLGGVRWPVLDVGLDATQDRFWVLMEDVGAGIRDRGAFSRADSRTLFRALAQMQAPFWNNGALDGVPLPDVWETVRVFSEPLLHLQKKRPSNEPWVTDMLDGFKLMGVFLPTFVELLGPALADEYLALCADEEWPRALAAHPSGLLHGDLRRANIAFEGEQVALIDWEFAAKGPPAADLQWHCFLHYWGYPPSGTAGGSCDDLRDEYVVALEEHLGEGVDREAFAASWDLAWIKVMVQLGYVLVDPLYPDGGDAETRARIAALSAAAVRRALDAREAHC